MNGCHDISILFYWVPWLVPCSMSVLKYLMNSFNPSNHNLFAWVAFLTPWNSFVNHYQINNVLRNTTYPLKSRACSREWRGLAPYKALSTGSQQSSWQCHIVQCWEFTLRPRRKKSKMGKSQKSILFSLRWTHLADFIF